MKSIVSIVVASAVFWSAPASAQDQTTGGGFDLTIGRHETRGAPFSDPVGLLVDALVAARVREYSRWSLVAGGGLGIVLTANGDNCVLTLPSHACAPRAGFSILDALVGVSVPIVEATARAMVGPIAYNGGGASSLGLQARADLSMPIVSVLGFGLMVRGVLLPSHNGQRLTMLAIGGSVTLR